MEYLLIYYFRQYYLFYKMFILMMMKVLCSTRNKWNLIETPTEGVFASINYLNNGIFGIGIFYFILENMDDNNNITNDDTTEVEQSIQHQKQIEYMNKGKEKIVPLLRRITYRNKRYGNTKLE